MTTETEALRADFESTVSEWGWDTYRNKAGDYATTSTNGAWAGYQAGHAAAKAEIAGPGVGEPYATHVVTTMANGRDRIETWKTNARFDSPDRSIDLYTADQLAAAVAAERERCLRIVESVDNYSNPMTANDCADAIRAGAKESAE